MKMLGIPDAVRLYPKGERWAADVPTIGAKTFSSRKCLPWEMKTWHDHCYPFTLWLVCSTSNSACPKWKSLVYSYFYLVTQTNTSPLDNGTSNGIDFLSELSNSSSPLLSHCLCLNLTLYHLSSGLLAQLVKGWSPCLQPFLLIDFSTFLAAQMSLWNV